ncbi:ImmA/IrrE family metallo-endopeptidase [Corynebacterium sp. YIM 101645]|uniref:ImmA/IrrE family metallo-endopeptidase n=1 Tax=Corynebacterium lemuris TaxID=1859292 RepID=A0ABT2FWZ9_9CORY|nr:ImmA/IrrE family metallo-endopeptidase [Corynebacterium lemuris]
MLALENLAATLGVTIMDTPRLRPDVNAVYLHHRRIILLRYDLDPYTRRCALAHELGHAYHGDQIPGDPRIERRADEFAARILITPEDYAAAEALHHSVGAIAHELEVTPHLVEVWQDLHERTQSP